MKEHWLNIDNYGKCKYRKPRVDMSLIFGCARTFFHVHVSLHYARDISDWRVTNL